jgi:DNA-binding GntR family transcriptional regulator
MQIEPAPIRGGSARPTRAGEESLQEKAYQYIQAKILSGGYSGGEVLSEQALSREIGVSRTPVREALGKLTGEGFLEQVRGRGTSVKRPSRTDVVELFELREALELYAVGKVARRGLPEREARRLEELCDQLAAMADELERRGDRRLSRGEMERFLSNDLQYHLLILRAAGNRRIVKLVRDARLLIRILAMPHETHDLEQLRRIHSDHRGILDAVLGGDSVRSMGLCETHIRRSRQQRLDEYERWERISQMRLEDALTGSFLAIEGGEDGEL